MLQNILRIYTFQKYIIRIVNSVFFLADRPTASNRYKRQLHEQDSMYYYEFLLLTERKNLYSEVFAVFLLLMRQITF
jgi:hypothetical protein